MFRNIEIVYIVAEDLGLLSPIDICLHPRVKVLSYSDGRMDHCANHSAECHAFVSFQHSSSVHVW